MIDANSWMQNASQSITSTENVEIQQRLNLYQVFLRLYEQNRGLLDEILSLEHSSNNLLVGNTHFYIQGVVLKDTVYLLTNLLKGKTQVLRQPQNIWTIGRDSRKVNLPISDRRLSRCHAAIQYNEGKFQLIDLESSNGSYVNGELVRYGVTLKDGDQIRLGSLTLNFFHGQLLQTLDVLPTPITDQINAQLAAHSSFQRKQLEEQFYENDSDTENLNRLDDTMLFLKSEEAKQDK